MQTRIIFQVDKMTKQRKHRDFHDIVKFLFFIKDHDLKDAPMSGVKMPDGAPLTVTAARSWLFRIRKLNAELDWYVGQLRTLQRISPRIRKLTTAGNIRETDDLGVE
jgi:hypothetical protein